MKNTRDPLCLNARGGFKILQMTDLHYSDNEAADARSDAFQVQLLQIEKPDFVVYTGDMVSGWVYMNMPHDERPNDSWYAGIHARYTKGIRT